MNRIEEQVAEALAEELSDLMGGEWDGQVSISSPPEGAVAGAAFAVAVRRQGWSDLKVELPCGLAIGYLGDEENAVDAWKGWTEELARRLRQQEP
jgi:hypothetical protein